MLRATPTFLWLLCLATVLCATDIKAAEVDVLGRWKTHKGGEIEFEKCGDKICGHISKLARSDHLSPPTDTNNPEPTRRMVPLLGLTLFKRFEYVGDDRWENGRIYNVENGKTYRSKLRLLSPTELKLSGCVFIFCRSYKWHRLEEKSNGT
jgi:uncharacterized protein (DUF2147 family)